MDKFREKIKEYVEEYVFEIFYKLAAPYNMEQLYHALRIMDILDFTELQEKARKEAKSDEKNM